MKAIKYALLGLAGVIGMLVSMFGPVKVPFAEGLAKTYYRYALGALLLIALLISAAVGLFIVTFDANNFKSEIVRFVKARTQRDLVLEGNIKVTFFPKLGIDSGRALLSQRNSAREFASVENTLLYIAWLPLLRRQLVFDHVKINGAHANLIRLKDGTTNYDDLLISDSHLAPLTFDIDSVHVANSTINWQDEMTSRRVSLHDLQIETGRLADKAPSNLTSSFRLDLEKVHFNANVHLKSRLFFDRKEGRYEFANIEGMLEGEAAGISDLVLDFAGSLDSHPAQGLLKVDDIVVHATGKRGQHAVGARLDAPRLQLDKGSLIGQEVTLDVNSSDSDETLAASVRLPAFEFSNNIFNAASISADFDFKGGERSLQAKLKSPVNMNFESAPKLQLDAINFSLSARHQALANKLNAFAEGTLSADFAEQNASLIFSAIFNDSKINGFAALKDFTRPVYTLDVSANHFDLDHYIATDWIKRFQDDATPFEPKISNDVTLNGNLRVDEIKLAKIKANKLAATFKIEQSTLSIPRLTAKLYGGILTGSISVDAQGTPRMLVKQSLKDFQMGSLLADTDSAGKLKGKGKLDMDISAEGGSVGALRKSLNGRASLELSRGSLAGIDLRAALLEGRSELGVKNAMRTHDAKFTEKSDFSALNATFNFKGGDLIDNSFEMKSPLIRTTGNGSIHLSSGNISYLLDATVSSSINRRTAGDLVDFKGITVPVSVSGLFAKPSIALNFGSASGGNVAQLGAPKDATAAQPGSLISKPVNK